MENQNFHVEDSRSITEFFKPQKKLKLIQKRSKKQEQEHITFHRKNSTQMSIFGWLSKSRKKQSCKITTLPKTLVISIYKYLRVFQIIKFSQSCYYLTDCARSIWHDWQFFGQVDTAKMSPLQLKKVIEKSAIMGHIKQLRNIYLGKNIQACRQKIKLKVKNNSQLSQSLKPMNGKLLQTFQISPKAKNFNAFLTDTHLQQVINSSFRSLTSIKLQSCHFITKFKDFYKCQQLTTLVITNNSCVSSDDLRLICKNCGKLEVLDLSGCDNLDQNIFKHITKLSQLRILSLNDYHQSFGDLQLMQNLGKLEEIHLKNSCIIDNEAIILFKEVKNLKVLNLNGCQFLTCIFLFTVLSFYKNYEQKGIIDVKLERVKIEEESLMEYYKDLQSIKSKKNAMK